MPEPNCTGSTQHNPCGVALGRAARTKIADARAADLLHTNADIRASGASSLREIAAGLNERDIRAARGGKWTAAQVQRILARSA